MSTLRSAGRSITRAAADCVTEQGSYGKCVIQATEASCSTVTIHTRALLPGSTFTAFVLEAAFPWLHMVQCESLPTAITQYCGSTHGRGEA